RAIWGGLARRSVPVRGGQEVRLVSFSHAGALGVGVLEGEVVRGRLSTDPQFPGDLDQLIKTGRVGECERVLREAPALPAQAIRFRPPVSRANKIICVGLNYREHTTESGYAQPDYPTFFIRLNTSLVGHR